MFFVFFSLTFGSRFFLHGRYVHWFFDVIIVVWGFLFRYRFSEWPRSFVSGHRFQNSQYLIIEWERLSVTAMI